MTDEYGQIGPEKPSYLSDVAAISRMLRSSRRRSVIVYHVEFVTKKTLLLVPGDVIESYPVHGNISGPRVRPGSLFVTYMGHGSLEYIWDGPGRNWLAWGYVAEKLDIEKWPPDAKSVANFLNRLAGWDDKEDQ